MKLKFPLSRLKLKRSILPRKVIKRNALYLRTSAISAGDAKWPLIRLRLPMISGDEKLINSSTEKRLHFILVPDEAV